MRNVVNQQGAQTAAGQSAQAFYGWGGEIYNAMGGSWAGTAMASMMMQLRAGVMPQHVMREMIRNGWVDLSKLVKEGNRIRMLPGALRDEQQLVDNPYEGIANKIQSAQKARGKNDQPVSAEEVLFNSFGRQTSMREAAEVMALLPLLKLFSKGIGEHVAAHPLDAQARDARQNSPDAVMRSFRSA